jgi:UDP-N-acetylglucosamine 1-carboxyvinyltransferase
MHENDRLRIRASRRLRAVGRVETAPYPGFPTDAQPLLMAALLRAEGESLFRENIFENRFRHVPQLRRLGARIRLEGREALVTGVERLDGAAVESTDLRGGAAMILTGLQARGETLVWDRGHVRRGYEDFDGTLRNLGAEITYEGDSHGIFV